MKSINCILLSGGQSTRMGQDKALLSFGNTTVLNFLVKKIQKMKRIREILICTNNSVHHIEGTKRYADLYQNCGPIGGLYTGLYHSTTDYNWVVSCDAPFINESLLDALLENITAYDTIIPVYKGKEMYTLGLYHKNLLPKIENLIKETNYKLKNVLKHSTTHYQDLSHFDESIFINLNTFEAYQAALNNLSHESNH